MGKSDGEVVKCPLHFLDRLASRSLGSKAELGSDGREGPQGGEGKRRWRRAGFKGDDAMCVRTQLEGNKWPGTLC